MNTGPDIVPEPLTYLFVPASEERKVMKALASGADAIILDLEDGVADDEKPAARRLVRDALSRWSAATRSAVWVRVNGADPDLREDLACIEWSSAAGAVLPMAESGEPLRRLRAAGAARLLPIVETAAGFDALAEVAAVEGVERVAIGTYDFALDIGLLAEAEPDDLELIWQVRGDLVVRSRQLRLQPPIDGVYGAIDDEAGLRAVCHRARRMGFAGKLLIHPRQIAAAREAFMPRPDDLQFAREIIAAYDAAAADGRGAVRVRGRMIDRPMVERARGLLSRWRDGETSSHTS